MLPMFALKAAAVPPAGITTLAGTVISGELALTVTVVGAATACESVAEQEVVAPDITPPGPQARELIVGEGGPITVPPVPNKATAAPNGVEAAVLVTPMADVVTPAATVKLTSATTPLEMMPAFSPEARQLYEPLIAEQLNVLPALPAAGPAVTEMETRLAGT
jgi:hypothetical protein